MFFKAAFVLSQVPVWHWAKDANSASPETLWDVSCDPTSTDVYIVGSFKGNLSSKYGASFSSATGITDGLVAKYDALGNVLWAFKISGATGDEEVRGVAVDPSGNVYVTGSFNSTTDFDPSASIFNLTSAGGTDGFLAKYSSVGSFLWAVKFGGANNEDSFKMAVDANGIYITGSYESIPTTFYSYSSAITKTTFFNSNQLNMFGAKYDANGVVQWVISGGSNLDDYGVKVIADASNVYFIGIYYHDISFKSATGISSAIMPDEQHNEANTFILQVTQAGNLGWQTNITTSTGGKNVNGHSIAQDAGNIYVTGQSDGNINFKYPTPTLTQAVSTLNDLFLAKLSKVSGTFLWKTNATGNGTGDQIGRALDVDGLGNIILGGNFNTGLNYTSVSGPNFTASAQDVFITGYNNAGTFLWSYKAGGAATENFNGLDTDNFGNVYLAGDHGGAATFGTVTLGTGGGTDIYLAKLGCAIVANNTIPSTQAICSGNTPSTLAGSLPVNGNLYTWEMSANSSTWTNATGTYTNQNYSPPPLTATTYYRRIVNGAGCLGSPSNTLQITVAQLPSISNAGNSQTVCSSTITLAATNPTVGNGLWSVITGSGNFTSASNPSSQVTSLSTGANTFLWTVSNGACPSSTSTVIITRDDFPSIAVAGPSQTLCSTTTTLNANTPLVGIGLWSSTTGTGSIGSPSSAVTPVNNLSVGQNKFVWTVSNGICPMNVDTVVIKRDELPSLSNAGTDQHICGVNVLLTANTPVIGTGNWSFISGNGTIDNGSNPVANISGISPGINELIWTISNGVCLSSIDTVIILSDVIPTIADAGNDRSVCSANVDLSANVPLIGVGSWSVLSGSASINNSGQNNSSVTNLSIGSNTFRWTIENGVCPATTDDITITQDLPPSIAVAGPDQETDKPVADIAAITPSVGNGFWSVIEGDAQIVNATNANTSVTDLSIGNNVIRWTTTNGVCPESSDDILIYVKPLNIPNGFSPNQDGFNDMFMIPTLEFYSNVKFNVFNRWGSEVYSNNDYKNNWNGTNLSNEKLADDTYYYVLEINSKLNFTGFIVLKQNK
ncbi:MAG: gliding motility-associated C-terminal domain-containing protein [Bacteroidia bacterium]